MNAAVLPVTAAAEAADQQRQWALDGQLVRACQAARSEEHFAALVQRHETWVRNLLRALCGDAAQADDLAQDSFIIAWQKLSTLKVPEKFQGWLKQLAYRQFLHWQRRQKLEARHAQTSTDDGVMFAGDIDIELQQSLQHCSGLERELLLLHYGFGFTVGELAESQGSPAGTIKSHLHRARQKIRQHLEAEGSLAGRPGDV